MRKILLTLLKAEKDLASVVGERKSKHYWRQGGTIDINDLRTFIEGEREVVTVLGSVATYPGGSDSSYNRSLNKLVKSGLVNVLRITSPRPRKRGGGHGYLYKLTDKGKELANKYLKQIRDYMQENQKYL